MKTARMFITAVLLFLTMGAMAQSKKDLKIIKNAESAKKMVLKTDPGLKSFFDDSQGYIIFPNVGKGGLIIGGASGHGVAYTQGKMVGMANLKEINVGFEAGGQSVVEVIFFQTSTGMKDFLNGQFTVQVDATAVVVKEGAAKTTNFKNGIAIFAKPKAGLMAGISVGGQKITYAPKNPD